VKLYQKTRILEDYADSLGNWEHKFLLLHLVSRQAHESICRVLADCSEEIDSDDSSSAAVPTEDVVH
jgi:hypothetical protein